MFRRLGNGFIGIDGTHNITQYEGMELYTMIARDRWGQGKRYIYITSVTDSLRCCAKFRRACCLDADVKQDNGNAFFFCCLDPGSEPSNPAICNNDRLRSGANCRTRGRLHPKQCLPVHMARAARDLIAFSDNGISGALG